MTTEQMTALAGFLDTAGDYLGDGYARPREARVFTGLEGRLSGPPPPAGEPRRPAQDGAPSWAIPNDTNDTLEGIAADICSCRLCPLGAGRTRAVPGEGAENPLVMVIGEGPGEDEDRTGRPFVGRAGQLLDKMLAAIGLRREENCFIANVVKCRPPENRDPSPTEARSCRPFLDRQIACLRPRIIFCAGKVAANFLLGTLEPASVGSLRGRFFDYAVPDTGGAAQGPCTIPLLASYHPSALLRNEDLKRPAWEDLKLLRSKLEELKGF